MKLIYTPYDPDDKRRTVIIGNIEEGFILQAIKLIIAAPEKFSLLQQTIQQEANTIIIKYPQETGTVLAVSFYKDEKGREDITKPLETFHVSGFQNLPTNQKELISLVNPSYQKSILSLIKYSINNDITNTVLSSTLNIGLIYSFGFWQGSLLSAQIFMKNRPRQEMYKKIEGLPSPLKSRFKRGLQISSALLILQGFTALFSLFPRRRHDGYILDSQGFRTDITPRAAEEMSEEIIGQSAAGLSLKTGLLFIKNSGSCLTTSSRDTVDFCQLALRQPDDTASAESLHALVQYQAPSHLILDNRPETLWSWIGGAFNNLLGSAASYVSDYFAEATDPAGGFSLQDTLHSLGGALTHWMVQPEVNATLVQSISEGFMRNCHLTTPHRNAQWLNNGTLSLENCSFP